MSFIESSKLKELSAAIDAITCEGCRLGLKTINVSPLQWGHRNRHVYHPDDDPTDADISFPCTAKSAEILALIASAIEHALDSAFAAHPSERLRAALEWALSELPKPSNFASPYRTKLIWARSILHDAALAAGKDEAI